MFRRIGAKIERIQGNSVVDLDWRLDELGSWCIASISLSLGNEGGSTLQMLRISEIVCVPVKEIEKEFSSSTRY